jgi:ribosome-associated toxin RatA of RatAB toxin-antitoxin module
MPHIHHEGLVEAPVEVLFAYVDDYRNTTKWLFGLSKFDPTSEVTSGLGSTFDGTFAVKPIKLHSSVKIVEWVQGAVIAVESYKGFQINQRWEFSATGPETSKVIVDVRYELPGGLAGKAMGRAIEPIVALSVRHSDDSLRKHVAAAYIEGR